MSNINVLNVLFNLQQISQPIQLQTKYIFYQINRCIMFPTPLFTIYPFQNYLLNYFLMELPEPTSTYFMKTAFDLQHLKTPCAGTALLPPPAV